MAPSKLTITPKGGTAIDVMFNPNTYNITKTVAWRTSSDNAASDASANAPIRSFGGGGSRQLSLQLFFDATEAAQDKRDVRLLTDPIVRLTRIGRKNGRPPVCTVAWGAGKDKKIGLPFDGVISHLKQNFVLFDSVGRPLRAWLDVTFLEFLNREDDERETDPETSTRIVRRNDSLASIAADVYDDAGQWRLIALANGIEDPFVLPAGTKLTVPKV